MPKPTRSGRDNCDMIRGWLEFCVGHYQHWRHELRDLFDPEPEGAHA